MRITRTRVIVQVFFFGLFLWLVLVNCFSHLRGWPVSLFLEIDPLVALSTALATHGVYRGLLWALAVIIPTILLGRVFCGWVCPYGALHHFVGWLGRQSGLKRKVESNVYRRSQSLKYLVLIVMLIAALFGSVQLGLLDPLVQLHRAFTLFLLPAGGASVAGTDWGLGLDKQWAWTAGLMFVVFVALNLYRPRWFCRVLCPLGALLGLLSRFALFRIRRDPDACNDCQSCLAHCEGACEPNAKLRLAECFVCFNCLNGCQPNAFTFQWLAERQSVAPAPDLTRRQLITSGLLGAAAFPLLRLGGAAGRGFGPAAIRPPGALRENEFLQACIKCEQCLRVCPTNVIQPALLETGLEGLWTPVLKMKFGACSHDCVLCGHVCPTGAIERLSAERKTGRGEWEGRPTRIGTAFFDRGRCLPWAMERPCSVCQEVCPTSPKAIYTRTVKIIKRDGAEIELKQPYVDPPLCTGCGKCEHHCPVEDLAAVRVTPIGETRDPKHGLLI